MSRRFRPSCLLLFLLLGAPCAVFAAAPTVHVTGGTLAGRADGRGGAVFEGIPFAAPPTGRLRWRPPQPVVPWHGVREALKEAPSCPQNDYGWNHVDAHRYSEDCLYLDVHTPQLHPSRPLPVVVWIHGGSNRCGSAAGIVQSNLVRRGVVVVAIQYRLGVLGFLSLPALSREQGGHSGNYGLMDQIQALRWVQHNIARFGGDPHRVTISGQSAGAQDVGLLMVAHDTRGLFRGAWANGGSPDFGQPPRTLVQNEAIGLQLPGLLHVSDRLAALRKVPVKRLLAADLKLHGPALTSDDYLWLQAVVDGRVLRQPPALAFAMGRSRRVPYVVSTDHVELPVPGGAKQIGRYLARQFGNNLAAARRFYGLDGHAGVPFDRSYGSLAQRIGTDTDFRCTGDNVLRMHVASGAPGWRDQVSVEAHGKLSHHSAELPYLFNDLAPSPAQPHVTIQAYLARFIATGNPNGPGLPHWPRFDTARGHYVDFTTDGVQVGTGLGGAICRLTHDI